MELSARNQLKARIKGVKSDTVSTEVIMDVGGQEVCSTITTASANRMGLKEGDEVRALIKASSVMIMK